MTVQGASFTHPKQLGERIGPIPTGALNTAAAELRVTPAQQQLWDAKGWWSNVDVYVDVPETWQTAAIAMELYAVTQGVEALVAATTIPAALLQPVLGGGGAIVARRGIVLSGRGHPASSWLVRATNFSGIVAESGQIVGEIWGDQSPADGIGAAAGQTIRDHRMSSRAAHLMGLPLAGGTWLPLATNAVTRQLQVETTVVIGVLSPAAVADALISQNYGASADQLIKGAAGRVFSAIIENLAGGNRWLQLHNKLAALAPGDVPRVTVKVPANSTVILGSDFFGQQIPNAGTTLAGGTPFSAAIRMGFSTTAATYTAGVAANQNTNVTYF